MDFLEKIFRKEDDTQSQEDIGSMASEAAVDFIRELSGEGKERTKKLVDNVVMVTNAAGGTGASTVVSNVAYMADRAGLNVLVLDLDIMYPTQHLYFGIKSKLEADDLVSFLSGRNSLGESINTKGSISVLYSNNRGLSDAINCEMDTEVQNFNTAINSLRELYDLILIDAPMSIDNTLVNTAMYISDQIYLVWDEGLSSIANTERIRRNMAISGIDSYTKMGIILNKKTSIHYSRYPMEKLNMELVEVLPFELEIIRHGLRSEIFCDKGASRSENALEFYEGIKRLTNKILENGGLID